MGEAKRWPDLLFGWMSERGSGSYADLNSALHWLVGQQRSGQSQEAIQTRTFLRGLSDLGMAENVGTRWSVAPPVVSCLPGSDGSLGVLTGSRTPALDTEVDIAASKQDVKLRRLQSAGTPVAILLCASKAGAFERLAREVGALYVPCAAEQLAALLAPAKLDEWPEVFGPDAAADELRCFDAASMRFRKVVSAPASGLAEVSAFGRTRTVFGDGNTWRHVRRASGVYFELARTGHKVISWTAAGGGTLSVPSLARLPALPARVATLCSGVPPAVTGERLLYTNVPMDVASTICRAVGQPSISPREGQNARA
jgi:hypothetical protein